MLDVPSPQRLRASAEEQGECTEGWPWRVTPFIGIAKWASAWIRSEAAMRRTERDSASEKLISREAERGLKESTGDELVSAFD